MSVVPTKQLPPLTSDELFEELCLHIWRRLLNDPSASRYGRPGQKQHGVDLLGRRDRSEHWVGIQCKVRRSKNLRPDEIEDDLKAAKNLNPRLSEFVIATTVRRDARLQDFAREQTARAFPGDSLSIQMFFWDDVEAFLLDEANLDLLQRYYGEFLVEAAPTRRAVARMFTLRVGVGSPVTQYEVLIGKTLAVMSDENPSHGLAYFKGLAFIVDLNARRADVFRLPCAHWSDIGEAITNETDRYIITKWLNSFANIDELIQTPSDTAVFCISADEWRSLHCAQSE